MPEEIRVLAVRQPWASLIVEGLKTIEVRSKPTNIRGKIAIYATDLRYSHSKVQEFFDHFDNMLSKKLISDYVCNYASSMVPSSGPRGYIIGTVEITGCVKLRNDFEYSIYQNEHLSPAEYYKPDNTYYWDLKHPVKFSKPIPYKPPKGAIVWSKTTLPEGY